MMLSPYQPYWDIFGFGDGVYVMVDGVPDGEENNKLWLLRWNSDSRELETFYAGEKPNYIGMPSMTIADSSLLIYSQSERTGDRLSVFDLEKGTLEEQEPPESLADRYDAMDYHTWYMSTDLSVMAGSISDRTIVVSARNMEGTVLLEQTYEMDWTCKWRHSLRVAYLGRDETNLYLYCTDPIIAGVLVAVALDGSGADILWEYENNNVF